MISITGFASLDKKLAAYPNKVRKKIIRRSLREAARPVLATAKARAPVDSGATKRSLKLRSMRSRKRDRLGMSVLTGDKFFKGDQFYAAFAEFGARFHLNWGKTLYPLPPRPFMRPAHDENKNKVRSIFTSSIGRILTEL